MGVSEKIELLGKGLYTNIPDVLTLTSIPTGSELDYVGAEDFDEVMLTKILPNCIEEDIDPKDLLEIDYFWVLRALRLLNYGPYTTVRSIVCDSCQTVHHGEYQVNLMTVDVKPLPEGYELNQVISRDSLIDFKHDIKFRLLTIREVLNYRKDKQFKDATGHTNEKFARMCYMIKEIGGVPLDPVSVRMRIKNELSPADYIILENEINENVNYGLRLAGTCGCPVCGDPKASFISFIDERFFRPSVADLREWAKCKAK